MPEEKIKNSEQVKSSPELDFRLKLEISYKGEEGKGMIIEDEYGNPNKGLDMDFHIIKSYEPTPKESNLRIYNLTTSTYNLIYEKADAFRLSCARGKEADYVPFYTGYPIRAVKVPKETVLTSNQGFMKQDANAGRRGQSDLVTEISLMNFGLARLYKSYRTGVTSTQIIEDCITAFGLPKGNMDKIKEVKFNSGYSIRGDVSEVLNKLGKMLNFNWSINDMKFNIYEKSKTQFKHYGIVLNSHNSATPERQDDKFYKKTDNKQTIIKKENNGFMIETMLLPFLQVGSTCRLDYEMLGAQGDKYIYQIEHDGNNYGTDCTTKIYCV